MAQELSSIVKRQLKRSKREAYGDKPLDVHAQNVVRTQEYKDYLYRIVAGSWLYKMPNNLGWNKSYLKSSFINLGGFAVAKYKGAVVQFPFTVIERTIQHLPKIISSSDGEIKGRFEVGKDCEIVTLGYADISCTMYNYRGIIDLYAQRLANCDASIDINLLNCRTPFLFECNDGREAEDMRAIYTRIMNGEPAVYWRNTRGKNTLDNKVLPITILPVKENYITDKIIEAKRSIVSEFQSNVGLNNVEYEKKERLITGEVSANNDLIECSIAIWNESVKECCEKVRATFDIDFSISFKESEAHNDSTRPTGDIPNKEQSK